MAGAAPDACPPADPGNRAFVSKGNVIIGNPAPATRGQIFPIWAAAAAAFAVGLFASTALLASEAFDVSGRAEGADLFREIRRRVSRLAPQVPRYGGIVSAGHQRGADYRFEPRR